ncbi:hypothetical protein IPM62_01570 [Candidatus Woesebacteria bacterium]|nr:MAG: hypothetical protein IPM62_01570 [Candidatus Woesebacteria bacterium]
MGIAQETRKWVPRVVGGLSVVGLSVGAGYLTHQNNVNRQLLTQENPYPTTNPEYNPEGSQTLPSIATPASEQPIPQQHQGDYECTYVRDGEGALAALRRITADPTLKTAVLYEAVDRSGNYEKAIPLHAGDFNFGPSGTVLHPKDRICIVNGKPATRKLLQQEPDKFLGKPTAEELRCITNEETGVKNRQINQALRNRNFTRG